jgi:polar amino acid transport system substrate-binding protein
MINARRLTAAVAASALAILVTACAPASENAAESTAPDNCAVENLSTLTAGKITIGTDSPAYGPWFSNDDPSNGEGYESAVAYAVAKQLGFDAADVVWTIAPFSTVIAPGEKAFDFDINQVSITDERKQAVDFSSGYYDVNQAVITIKGSKLDGATTLAQLKDAKLGAQVGTTSYATITDVIAPTEEPSAFDSNDIAKQALANGQIDGLVVDLPTAFYITAVELDGGLIVGQFPAAGADGEQFGLVLNKDSALTKCVSDAVDVLRADGTLTAIQQEWLADVTNAPFFK